MSQLAKLPTCFKLLGMRTTHIDINLVLLMRKHLVGMRKIESVDSFEGAQFLYKL